MSGKRDEPEYCANCGGELIQADFDALRDAGADTYLLCRYCGGYDEAPLDDAEDR